VRITKTYRLETLRKVWLFERCSGRELDTLQRATTLVHLPAGRVLAEQGELGQEFVVILEGKANVSRNGTDIAVLEAGSFFGEMSLLEGKPRTATVTTLEPSEVLVLTRQAFNGVVATMPSVDRKMLTVLASRLRDIEARYVPQAERRRDLDIA
jgi:CRP/FNR family cyclic AMP-dependent transcriptional regulator